MPVRGRPWLLSFPFMPSAFPDRAMASSALDQLKHTLSEQGLYSPSEGDSPASHDDATLLSVPLPLFFPHPLK